MKEGSSRSDSDVQFVLENQDTRETIRISDTVKAGRGTDSDLVLDCVKCSRFHAELRLENGALRVEDQGSTNGSFVNGEQIDSPTSLRHGDLVQFGNARFAVIDLGRQSADQGGQKTVVAGPNSLRGVLSPEQLEAAKSQHPSSQDSPASSRPGDPNLEETAEALPEEPVKSSGKSKDLAQAVDEPVDTSERPASEPEPQEAAPRVGEPRPETDPSIPRSWADAERLEQTSHTSMMARPQTTGPGIPALDPNLAIAEAWRHVSGKHPILVGLKAPITGEAFELPTDGGKSKWEIGRGKGADIKIDAESVSGRHCQLVLDKGRWKIVNMMSVNGTFVNGRKVLSAYLKPGDVIRMGEVKLVFHVRVHGKGALGRSDPSGGRRLFTAPFRWLGRLFSRGGG